MMFSYYNSSHLRSNHAVIFSVLYFLSKTGGLVHVFWGQTVFINIGAPEVSFLQGLQKQNDLGFFIFSEHYNWRLGANGNYFKHKVSWKGIICLITKKVSNCKIQNIQVKETQVITLKKFPLQIITHIQENTLQQVNTKQTSI